jgi:DNA replication licensing factor MCM2
VDLRKESERSRGFNVTARVVEAIMRITQAFAKLRLHSVVTEDDLNMAITAFLESFISSQKTSSQRLLKQQFSQYLTYKKDTYQLLIYLLNRMCNEAEQYFRQVRTVAGVAVPPEGTAIIDINEDMFLGRARQSGFGGINLEDFYNSATFKRSSFHVVVNSRNNKKVIRREKQ